MSAEPSQLNPEPAMFTFFYDGSCGLCSTLRRFLQNQPTRYPIRLINLHSEAAQPLLREAPADPNDQLLATDGRGCWWIGADAWILCLWVSEKYHPWAERLGQPRLRPLALRFVRAVSDNRHGLSRLLRLGPDHAQPADLESLPEEAPQCALPTPR